MNLYYLKRSSRISVTAILCCVLVLVQVPVEYWVSAQLNCDPQSTPLPDAYGNKSHWSQNATVQVNVNSNSGQFSSDEFNNCIKPAFDNFNQANATTTSDGNFSGVSFSLNFSQNAVAGIDTTTGTSVNTPEVLRGFQINKGNPDPSEGDPNQITGGNTYPGDDGFYRNSATTIINPQITNCTALRNAVAHEIGHTMGLEHDCAAPGNPCNVAGEKTVMNNLLCGQTSNDPQNPCLRSDFNNETWGRGSPSDCDNQVIKCQVYKLCPRVPDLSGTVPTYSPLQTVHHEMHISNYNAATGDFEIRFIDYYATRPNYQSSPTYSSAPTGTYAVVDNTDACFNPDGSVRNVTQSSVSNPPTFGCTFSKNIALTFVRTENIFVVNNNYPFVKVYTGKTTPGTGIPYMHIIFYSQYNNVYSYAYN